MGVHLIFSSNAFRQVLDEKIFKKIPLLPYINFYNFQYKNFLTKTYPNSLLIDFWENQTELNFDQYGAEFP